MELNTAQLFFRTKKWHWVIALLAACVRKKPFMRHILCVYSVSGIQTLDATRQQDINEGKKKGSLDSLKLTQNTKRSVTLFEYSNMPKTDEVASVIAAETLPPTFHAADLKSLRGPSIQHTSTLQRL